MYSSPNVGSVGAPQVQSPMSSMATPKPQMQNLKNPYGSGGGLDINGDGSYQGKMEQGKKDLDQATSQANQYLDPYASQGPEYLAHYRDMLDKMEDPVAFQNSIMSRYEQSAGAKTKSAMGMNRIKQAMEAEGLTGTPDEMKSILDLNRQVTNEDMGDYYNRVMNGFNGYMKGYGGLVDNAQKAAGQQSQNTMRRGEGDASIYSAEGKAISEEEQAEADREAKQDDSWMSGAGAIAGGLISAFI